MDHQVQFETVGAPSDKRHIAYIRTQGNAPGVFWLGGYVSDMQGTKVLALDRWARRSGHAMTRFDYSGHGASHGAFADGTISRWLEEAHAIFDRHTQGAQIVVGSSMGAWIALLLARRLKAAGAPERLRAMVLIAPAPDFTERLMWKSFSAKERETIMQAGQLEIPADNDYEPYIVTRAIIEDGRRNLVMDGPLDVGCPVHILQGREDTVVPVAHALALLEFLSADDASITLIDGGDHRLSRDADIDRLIACVAGFAGTDAIT